jgi:hypothetical protein
MLYRMEMSPLMRGKNGIRRTWANSAFPPEEASSVPCSSAMLDFVDGSRTVRLQEMADRKTSTW